MISFAPSAEFSDTKVLNVVKWSSPMRLRVPRFEIASKAMRGWHALAARISDSAVQED